jgi:hypothetical protein
MTDITEFVSIDRLTAEEKVFLIQSLLELCARYEAYLGGDYPEFTEDAFQSQVQETQARAENILDGLGIHGGCFFF